jgi:hypothetical protein
MKFFLFTLCLLFVALFSLARAQDEQLAAPPDEIITDFGIEEFISAPKTTLSLGIRSLSGAKASFSGRGVIASFQPGSDFTTPNLNRVYNDGNQLADASPQTFTYSNGDGTTTTYTGPVTPAGQTNSWSYTDIRQLSPDASTIDMHAFSADIADSGLRQHNPGSGQGIELAMARDMGNLGKRIEWKLIIGASLNDIKTSTTDIVNATVTTTTDTYAVNLNGQPPPDSTTTLPYVAPHLLTVPRIDSSGNPVYDTSGIQYIDYVDNSIYLGNVPLGRTTTVTNGTVTDRWDLKGAYFTFRAGPSLSFLFTDRFRATLGAGVALIYAGTTYTVDQTYTPDVGDPLVVTATADESKLLIGYYADATLQYDFTDRAGIYAGAVYQTGGKYTETAAVSDLQNGSVATYKALVDLSRLQGFRMGMNYKF